MSLATGDSPVSIFNNSGCAQLLLVCEHASNFIPEDLDNLQLSDEVLNSHAAFDIGAIELAKKISHLLNAPLISSEVSRLVYDCNRSYGLTDTIPVKSEVYYIPGNKNLNETDSINRYKKYYVPFEEAISKRLKEFTSPPILLTIHSFTPIFLGEERQVDIGIIDDVDNRLSLEMIKVAKIKTDYCVEHNQPYGNGDNTTYTLSLHGSKNTLLNGMIEVKNSLLETANNREEISLLLANVISISAQKFGYSIPIKVNHVTDH